MAPHSSTLAWKIPCMEEPGRLQSIGFRRVGHNWATSLSLFTFHFHALEREMATHSSVLAWRIPGTGEPGGLPSMGLHRIGHDWSNLAAVKKRSFPGGDSGKELACQCRSQIPGLPRCPEGGRGNRLQYSCLENLMDRGAWQVMGHRVTKNWSMWSKDVSLFFSPK